MTTTNFEVNPVTRYDGARYPSATGAEPIANPDAGDDTDEPGLGVAATALRFALILGMALGLLACFDAGDYQIDRPPHPENVGMLGPDGPGPQCTPGQVWCADQGATVVFCDLDGMTTTSSSCSDYCVATSGPDYYSTGCDSEAADPCMCEYGVIDGEPVECTPGDVYCEDDYTAMVCDDYSYTPVDCNDYCQDEYGPDYYSIGCDAEAEEACQCEYGIIDGDWAECTPGDVYCADQDTAMTCVDGVTYTPTNCAEFCAETSGGEAVAVGCDAGKDPACLCDYGVADGVPADS